MIADKIILLNETVLKCFNENDEIKIIKAFTEIGLKVIEADFGFVWLNSSTSKKLELVYKSSNLPFTPHAPREDGRNYNAIKNAIPDFVSETKKTSDAYYVSKYVKSFVIIPLAYKKVIYGTMVFCFREPESFPKEKRTLSVFIGNSLAQAITIHRLVETEKERYKREAILKETETLLQQEKLKTEFIANATHELRTPLAIIKGNVDLALQRKSKVQKPVKTTFKAIDYEIEHLSNIISDLALLTSKGGGSKHRIVYDEVSIKPLIMAVVERCKAIARDKKISITTRSMPDVNIWGDKVYLEKMLTNLIRNSILYGNKNGHTIISARKSNGFINISVADDGIGISKEDLPHVFERFYKADKSHSSYQDSTGLGLAIVKWIAEVHGGEVGVKSTKNRGSIFNVSLPTKKIA